jgi:hypothetical protein
MSPKTLIIAAAALAASSAAVLPALAAPNDPATPSASPTAPMHPLPLRGTILFNLVDRNGDGTIDQDELAALTKAIFSAVDANADGKISVEEFDRALPNFGAGQPPRMGQFFHRGPAFGGFGMGGPRFHRPGDNRQGQLQDDQGPAGPGGPQQQLGDNGQPPQDAGPQQDFASLDKNGDGVLSPDEFAAGAPMMPGMPRLAPQQ